MKSRFQKHKTGEIKAFLGKDTESEGKLTFTGTVQVDGLFTGEINSSGVLIIGQTAKINSQVRADVVIISGEMRGDLFIRERVEIKEPGRFYGKVETPCLVIEEGAIFEGFSKMSVPERVDSPLGGESVDPERPI
ncbi:MAG: polymer-forming cytoskeletal protein [Deltaproteobacteria bacterium]|nr:polymer-forming cytoskeletal protein [Deltaproteobacteria bacterium]